MNKNIYITALCVLTVSTLSTFSVAEASGSYTESITINGTNDVEYKYTQHEQPKEEECCDKEYIYVKPYQYTTWSHYPRYNYHNYNPYGNQVIYTYNLTGFKTGPDGRTLTPLMERDLYDYHMPPPPQKYINVNPSFHKPSHNNYYEPPHHHR